MKQKTEKRFTLIPIGLLCTSGSLIASHYTNVPDFIKGFLMGIGIALMLLSIMSKEFKTS